MAYTLPGNKGVTVYSSPAEAMAAGKIDKVEQGSDGNLYATPHQGWLLRNMPWLVMGTMAAGAGMAAAGAGAGAASGALPSSSLPAGSLMGGPAAITSGAASSSIPLGGILASSSLPVGSLMGGAQDIASQGISHGVGSVAGDLLKQGGTSIGKKILNSLISPDGASGLAGVLGALMAKNNNGGGDIGSQYPQLNELLNMQTERVKRTDPLHQAVTQLAMNRMPTNVQQGPITNGPPTRWTPTKVG